MWLHVDYGQVSALTSVSRSLIVVAMAATKCRRWVLKTRSVGIPKQSDFEIVEEELPPLKDGGEILIALLQTKPSW